MCLYNVHARQVKVHSFGQVVLISLATVQHSIIRYNLKHPASLVDSSETSLQVPCLFIPPKDRVPRGRILIPHNAPEPPNLRYPACDMEYARRPLKHPLDTHFLHAVSNKSTR